MNISGDVTVSVLLKAKIDGWQVSLLLNIVNNINTLHDLQFYANNLKLFFQT